MQMPVALCRPGHHVDEQCQLGVLENTSEPLLQVRFSWGEWLVELELELAQLPRHPRQVGAVGNPKASICRSGSRIREGQNQHDPLLSEAKEHLWILRRRLRQRLQPRNTISMCGHKAVRRPGLISSAELMCWR